MPISLILTVLLIIFVLTMLAKTVRVRRDEPASSSDWVSSAPFSSPACTSSSPWLTACCPSSTCANRWFPSPRSP